MLRRTTTLLAATTIALAGAVAGATEPPAEAATSLRQVMWAGNNWDGTATIIDAGTRRVLRRGIDLVPDKEQELAAIRTSPDRLAFYLAIQQGPGEGHDQYVDDMFTTRDGRYLAVSRPSFGDVVWIDVVKAVRGSADCTAPRSGCIVREQQMDGYRTDHMALSPDGRRLLVSDSTEAQVISYSMVNETLADGRVIRVGDRLRTFGSGETPHESNFTEDGRRIFHASIGKVYTPGDAPLFDTSKGDRWFQIVANGTFKVQRRWDMGRELEESGHPDMSSAVRPMAVHPDERLVYYQVSFLHGLVEFDTQAPDANGTVDYDSGGIPEPRDGKVARVLRLPNRVPDVPREQYVNDSAHHGLAINEVGHKLCVAGTMSDYAAIVSRATFRYKLFDQASTGHYYGKPYWATEGPNNTCWLSLSDADAVAVIDFKEEKEIAYLKVGNHPQRVRLGQVPEAAFG